MSLTHEPFIGGARPGQRDGDGRRVHRRRLGGRAQWAMISQTPMSTRPGAMLACRHAAQAMVAPPWPTDIALLQSSLRRRFSLYIGRASSMARAFFTGACLGYTP